MAMDSAETDTRPAMPPISVLDLAPVPLGAPPAEALRNTLELAQHAERWGYRRYRRGHRPCRWEHAHDPGGCGRDHAAQPRPADHRRTVRHPRGALSWP